MKHYAQTYNPPVDDFLATVLAGAVICFGWKYLCWAQSNSPWPNNVELTMTLKEVFKNVL